MLSLPLSICAPNLIPPRALPSMAGRAFQSGRTPVCGGCVWAGPTASARVEVFLHLRARRPFDPLPCFFRDGINVTEASLADRARKRPFSTRSRLIMPFTHTDHKISEFQTQKTHPPFLSPSTSPKRPGGAGTHVFAGRRTLPRPGRRHAPHLRPLSPDPHRGAPEAGRGADRVGAGVCGRHRGPPVGRRGGGRRAAVLHRRPVHAGDARGAGADRRRGEGRGEGGVEGGGRGDRDETKQCTPPPHHHPHPRHRSRAC